MKCNGLVFAVLLMVICSDGFIFTKKKVDCLVSKWSMWSEVYGFGVRSKERVILRYPDNGGKACPTNTTILHYSPKKPTIKATASQIVTSFLHRNVKPSTLSPRSNYKRDVPIGLFRDLLIIIDSSGSVGHTNFNIAKQQVAELLGLLCPLPDPFNTYRNTGYNRAALIQYSRRVVEEFDFNAKKNIADLQSSIKKVRYIGSMTCTGDAFEKAINMFTSAKGMRQGTKHEVLILTDGQSNCGKSLSSVLPRLHEKATVFGLMIGDFSNEGKKELTSYVSNPKPDHLFAVESYQDLKELLKLIKTQIDGSDKCAPFDLNK